jgi:homoserine dehydrogenase
MTGIDVIEEIDTDVVVESTPTDIETGGLGLSYIETALRRKRHVITTNKGPLAVALPALMEQATYNGVLLRFSGTVGGGTPILNFGKQCLTGDQLLSVQGILNGTTNYILTKMAESNTPLRAALREAQDAGYAEADPTYDVEGIDAAAKLVIIANWLMDRHITIKDVDITGISGVTLEAVHEAKQRDEAVKLICSIDGDAVAVKPRSIPITHPLCVSGTLNAVTFNTEHAGEITIVGHGAGGVQTAGAVLRDLIDIRMRLILS